MGRWTCGGRELEAPLDSLEATRNEWLAEAQKEHDMAKVAAGRPKMKLAGQEIQWQWIFGQVNQLSMKADRRAALIGVMAGDAVPEATAAKWNGGDGRCRRGMREDVRHR